MGDEVSGVETSIRCPDDSRGVRVEVADGIESVAVGKRRRIDAEHQRARPGPPAVSVLDANSEIAR